MKQRPFDTANILTSCKAGEEVTVTGISAGDYFYLLTWAKIESLYVKKIENGAIVRSKPFSVLGTIKLNLSGQDPFYVNNVNDFYVRNIVSQFNKNNNPPTPWKVKRISEKDFMVYREPSIPNPQLL